MKKNNKFCISIVKGTNNLKQKKMTLIIRRKGILYQLVHLISRYSSHISNI